ncbi:ABC transporter permease [Pseudactinotalea terrae]|uniref:ABC transporter permease n=1 Tax=Pseudactinotalea terrae TaxID=1743262 RepID=UPI0012E2A9A0|nr:ABC transporter permease [Pseudactinotalea terrae]
MTLHSTETRPPEATAPPAPDATAEVAPAAAAAPTEPSMVRAGVRSFFRNRNNVIACAIMVPLVSIALLSPWLPLGNLTQSNLLASLAPPSLEHPFGTDKLGRDILARTFAGLRISILVGLAAATISLLGGMIIGTLAATLGKRVDAAVSSLVDVLMAFPAVLMAIVIVAVFGPGPVQLIIALGIASMPAAIRLQRSLALSIVSSTYMDAARMANASAWWNVRRHMLPNSVAPMMVVASIYAAEAILAEAALSFLGLGVVPPTPSLGNIIADGQNYLREAWWISTIPGLTIVLLSLSLHFFSDGVREQLDPALRATVMRARKERRWMRRSR